MPILNFKTFREELPEGKDELFILRRDENFIGGVRIEIDTVEYSVVGEDEIPCCHEYGDEIPEGYTLEVSGANGELYPDDLWMYVTDLELAIG